jgi:hypothetical protein
MTTTKFSSSHHEHFLIKVAEQRDVRGREIGRVLLCGECGEVYEEGQVGRKVVEEACEEYKYEIEGMRARRRMEEFTREALEGEAHGL